MKTLTLIRHGKSLWNNPGLRDIERPLKGRGVRSAYEMAIYLSGRIRVPALIVTSPAARALDTAFIFARIFKYPYYQIMVEEDLYETTREKIVEVISRLDDSHKSVMIFGHDPSLTEAVNYLTGKKLEKIPTSGAVSIRMQVKSWSETTSRKGTLLFFEYPGKLFRNENNPLPS